MGPGALRINWVHDPPNCTGQHQDLLSYYCQQHSSLQRIARIFPVRSRDQRSPQMSTHAIRRADVTLIPSGCSGNVRSMPKCLRIVRPDDPPVVVLLNKIFEFVPQKLALLRPLRERGQLLLVTMPTPHVAAHEASLGVPVRFLPYAGASDFGPHVGLNESSLPYRYDIGFTGSVNRYSKRYHMRLQTMGNNTVRERLVRAGVRIYTPGWLFTTFYIDALARTRVWFATTEETDHVSTRFFEVMASGRSMLLCNRNDAAYAPLGLRDGVHAAMFSTAAEFESKLLHYLKHDDERRAIVAAAHAFVLRRHTWHHRARELAGFIREAMHARARGGADGGDSGGHQGDHGGKSKQGAARRSAAAARAVK